MACGACRAGGGGAGATTCMLPEGMGRGGGYASEKTPLFIALTLCSVSKTFGKVQRA